MYSGLVLTTTMPARSTPNSATGYCRTFGIINATRSPRDQPGFLLQPRGERAAQFVQLREGQSGAHVGVGGLVAVGRYGFLEQLSERGVSLGSMSAGTPAG